MLQENEFAMLVIGVWVLIFFWKVKFRYIPEYHLFLSGFLCLFLSWIFTVLESYAWESALNAAEHFCYAAGAVILTVWCFKAFILQGKEG